MLKTIAATFAGALALAASGALAHPGRGIVQTSDGTVFFADAGRSVVWTCTKEGQLSSAAPGVHAHWLALDPAGSGVYADHLRYEPEGEKFRHGLVRITPVAGQHRVEDAIPPAEGAAGLAAGLFLIDPDRQLVRVTMGTPARLTRGPIGPAGTASDHVIHTFEAGAQVGGLAAAAGGGYLVSVDREVRSIDAEGKARVVVDKDAIARAAPADVGTAEQLYGGHLWGLCGQNDGTILVCDPTNRRVLRIGPDATISVLHTSTPPWAPVGITSRGDDVLMLEAGFEPPSRNLGPRVVLKPPSGAVRVLAEVPEQEPSKPYR